MSAQIAGLWVISGVNAVLLIMLLARVGGLLPLFRRRRAPGGDIDELVGTRLPPLRFRPASGGEPSAGRTQVSQAARLSRAGPGSGRPETGTM